VTLGSVRESTGSVSNNHVALVDFRQKDRPEIDRPDAVIGFFQADVMLFECVGDEEQLVLEPERAGVGDLLDQEVPRVFERGQSLGKGAGRGGVARAGRPAAGRQSQR